jgi:hypothetical protein
VASFVKLLAQHEEAMATSDTLGVSPMLQLRKEQIRAIHGDALREFEDRVIAIVAVDYPAVHAELGEDGTRRLVDHAIDFGATHRVVTEGGVTALVMLMIQYGEAFERSPDAGWAQGLLEHPTLPEPLKIDLLLQRMAGRSQGRVVVRQQGG